MTNLSIFRDKNSLSIVLERRDSGEIYKIDAIPFATRSRASARSTGLNKPLIVTASATLRFSRLSTWSFMSDCKGEITTVNALESSPAMSAGIWNVRDFPPPVGKTASSDSFLRAALTAFSCKGSSLYFLKFSYPKISFRYFFGLSFSRQ